MLVQDELGIDSTQKFDSIKQDISGSIYVQEQAGKLLNFYVADILCMSQIQNGTFRKNISKFDLEKAIEEVMMIQRDNAEAKQIDLRCIMVGINNNKMVITDKQRIQQVILSLQSNAIKFTPIGGLITITSSIIVEGDESYLKIEVTDNGCGISGENQKKLFKLFGYLEDTQQLNTQGIGLGLYITQLIVTAFEGTVTV